MQTYTVTCAECGATTEKQSPRAKYCGDACKKRANRRPSKTGAAGAAQTQAQAPAQAPAQVQVPAVGGLVGQVAADLAKVNVLDTIPGRAALALAYRIESPMETGSAAASMTRELSRLVAEAKALTPKQNDQVDDLDDSVGAKLRLVVR